MYRVLRGLVVVSFIFSVLVFAQAFKKNDRIIFYGDSNTEWGSYPKYIEKYFARRYQDLNLEFINAGQAGDCISVGYYSRFDEEVIAKKPNVLFILFGINDIDWGKQISDADFDTFLKHAGLTVQKALDSGVRDVYMLSYPITEAPMGEYDHDLCEKIPEVSLADDSPLQRLGDESIEISKSTCVAGICGKGLDVERLMRKHLGFFSKKGIRLHRDDGVHLNEDGNKVFAAAILKSLGEF